MTANDPKQTLAELVTDNTIRTYDLGLEEIVAAGICMYFNDLQRKNGTV